MSRLQRITGKPGSDFSDSKKALQSHRVQIKLKKTSGWATARRNLKRVAYHKNICICFLLEEAPVEITDINKRKVPWIPKLTWSSRPHSWAVITAETFHHKPESLCSFSELRAKKRVFFLRVCTSKVSEKFKNWIFIQYIQASTQTQMIFSSAEWKRYYLRWGRLKILLSDSMTEIIIIKLENSKLSPIVNGDSFWSFRIAGFCLRLHFYRNTFQGESMDRSASLEV